jgi:hypothetical protein
MLEKEKTEKEILGNNPMEEELCLVDSATTNIILRETKYFQTLTKRKEDVMTITGSNKAIIGSGRATFTLLYGYYYSNSECTLVS